MKRIRPIVRHFILLLALCVLSAAGAVATGAAQTFSTTTVVGTVYGAGGAPVSGTLGITWPAFTTAASQAVAAGTATVTIGVDGFFSVNLAPNIGAMPAGLYYTAVYHLSDGTTSTEYWQVPAAAQATLAQVRAQVMPAAQAVQAVNKAYVDQTVSEALQGQMTVFGGTLTGPLYLSGDPSQPTQAADKHYVDDSVAGALPLSGGVLTGPVTATRIGALYQADQFAGADFGAQLQACINGLNASYGGTCDARNFTGALSMAANLTVNVANATIDLPCSTLTTSASIVIPAGVRNVTLHGCASQGTSAASGSQGGTVIAYSGNAAAIQVGDSTYTTDTPGFHLDNVVVNTTAATASTAQAIKIWRTQEMTLAGLYLLGNANQTAITLDGTGNYTGGSIDDTHISGFQMAVNAIGHQVSNPATTDWVNASTFVRLHIDCPTSSGNPIAGTTGINLQAGDGNTFTGGDVESCATALHLGANAQNNTLVGLRNENSTNQVVADAGSQYNDWMTGGTMYTGELTDNGTHNSFLDTFHRSFNGLNGDLYRSQADATVTDHIYLGVGLGNVRGRQEEYITDVPGQAGSYQNAWMWGPQDGTSGQQTWSLQDMLNNVQRFGVQENTTAGGSPQTYLNAAGAGSVCFNCSTNAGTGGVNFSSGGATPATVATVDKQGDAQFNGTLQVNGTSQSAGTLTVRNNADAEVDYYLWPGLTASQKGSFTYKDWNGNSQWYMLKDASNNWALNSAVGALDSFKAYQSTNSGDTYIDASNATGHIRLNYETGAGAETDIYTSGSANLAAAFLSPTSIKLPGLAAASGHNCVQIDNSGYLTNTGAACGTGTGGSGTVNSGNSGQVAYYSASGTAVSGLSTVPVSAGGTGAATAAAALTALGGLPLAGGTLTGALTATQFNGPLSGNVTGNVTGNVAGNASTATALAATPAQCGSGSYATGVGASGVANCAQVAYAQLGGTVPTWNQNTTGTSGNVTGTVALGNGGTGATTAAGAMANLLPGVTTYSTNGIAVAGNTKVSGSLTASSTVTLTSLAAASGHNCVQVDTSGNVTNTGAACGSGGTNGTVNSGTTGQIAYYNANGTAVSGTTTLSANVNGVFNVTTYGAVGNCTSSTTLVGGVPVQSNGTTTCTDNHAAIQAAITAAYAVNGSVYFPANPSNTSQQTVYYTSAPIDLQGVSVYGPPASGGDSNNWTTDMRVALRGAPGKDVFEGPDPTSGSYVTWLQGFTMRDLGIMVDSTSDVSAANTTRRPGRTVGDISMAQNSTTITSTSTADFQQGDVGQAISVAGAGASGAALVTTITAVTSSTQATVATAASTAVTNALTYISVMNLPVTQNIGNCGFALDDATGSSSGTTVLDGANFIDVVIQDVPGQQNNVCGYFLQGQRAPYQSHWIRGFAAGNYAFVYAPPDAPPCTSGCGEGSWDGMGDTNSWDQVYISAKYPFLAYDGGMNKLAPSQVSNADFGPEIVGAYGIRNGPILWDFDISEEETGTCANSGDIAFRIGPGYDNNATRLGLGVCSNSILHWDSTVSTVNNFSTGMTPMTFYLAGDLNEFTSSWSADWTTQDTTWNVTGRGNRFFGGREANAMDNIQPGRRTMVGPQAAMPAQLSRPYYALARSQDFIDKGAANYYYNSEDLWMWSSELDWYGGSGVPLIVDATAQSGQAVQVPTQTMFAATNGANLMIGSQIPAGKIRIYVRARGDSTGGTFTLFARVDEGGTWTQLSGSNAATVTTAYGLYWFDTDTTGLTGDQFGVVVGGPSTTVDVDWIAVRPWDTTMIGTSLQIGQSGTAMTASAGTGGVAQETTSAAKTAGDEASFDANGNVVDSGVAAGNATEINGGAMPASANGLATNGSSQPVAQTAHNASALAGCTTTNSGNAYTCATTPSFTPAAGDQVLVKFNAANTGSATLNVNSGGAATIYKWGNTATLASGDLQASHYIRATYDGSHWQLEGQLGNALATALASTPAQCTSGQYATGIAASGNASCSQVNYSQLAGTPGRTATGWCNGTATASTTLSLFGLGSTSTACTGALASGPALLMTGSGTLSNLVVSCSTTGKSSSSGVFTVYDAPSGTAVTSPTATGLTVTYGTTTANTMVSDTTHTYAYAKGDKIAIQFTTQASETLGGCTASFSY